MSETWVLHDTLNITLNANYSGINFTSNGSSFDTIDWIAYTGVLKYQNSSTSANVTVYSGNTWVAEGYKTIVFENSISTAPAEILAWFRENGDQPITYTVNYSDLANVARAIRTKTGSSDAITFPLGFTTSIGSIPTYETYTGAIANLYSITPTLSHCTGASGNATVIASNETVTLTYTAESGYTLPASVSVTGATSTWTQATGTLVLSNATGNVSFSITGEPV